MLPSLGIFLLLAIIIVVIKNIFSQKINGVQVLVLLGLVLITTISGYFIADAAKTYDTQIISGKVISKNRETVPCEHSYQCHCHNECSGSGKNRSCTEECDTCYEHNEDYDWDVQTTVGTFTIDRIDRQGLDEPTRWSQVYHDDPVSRAISYVNYIKAAPDSLYHHTEIDPQISKISYPNNIYDYYKINRVVDVDLGVSPEIIKSMNEKISLSLRDLASAKQVNIVIVLTKNPSSMFAEKLKNSWLGGKKNDLILVVAGNSNGDILWDDVFSWSNNDMANVSIRDAVRNYGKIDDKLVDIAVDGINKYWQRKRMHTYEYLTSEIEPTTFAYIMIFLVGLVLSGGLMVFFVKSETGYRRY